MKRSRDRSLSRERRRDGSRDRRHSSRSPDRRRERSGRVDDSGRSPREDRHRHSGHRERRRSRSRDDIRRSGDYDERRLLSASSQLRQLTVVVSAACCPDLSSDPVYCRAGSTDGMGGRKTTGAAGVTGMRTSATVPLSARPRLASPRLAASTGQCGWRPRRRKPDLVFTCLTLLSATRAA